MRWLRLVALAASLLLVMASARSHGFAREIAQHNLEARSERRPSTPSSPSSVAVVVPVGPLGGRRCKSKTPGFCGFLAQDKTSNSTVLDDDKRVVPTGPNPLHNR
ncbi:hypothetical protein Taro_011597 [Colocasia esculenta]|uniref:Uncharacterized protein n=1 Tax=Colocasia esculenta TaxID=4460 RepID=A0A843UB37_COLES|nr:hypothetical protein [Colocasia esculenta]